MDKKFWDFDSWAKSYDVSVRDGNWIHENYDQALRLVAQRVVERVKWRSQSMLDIGAGTGNLESLLVDCNGLSITAVEPSASMREKFSAKHPNIGVFDGCIPDKLPIIDNKFDIITLTYVIHHVPFDQLKKLAETLCNIANDDAQIIIVDPMFESAQFREEHVAKLKTKGHNELAEEIEDEFFHSVAEFKTCFENHGFEVETSRLTFYVWMIQAKRP